MCCSDLYSIKLSIYYKTFWRYSVVGALADRFDKICIAFLLPLATLSKYLVASSLLFFFRVLGDEFLRLLTSKHLSWKLNKIRSARLPLGIVSLSVLSMSLVCFILLYAPFTQLLLGKVWILPFGTLLALSIQEAARFYFNYSYLETSSLTEKKDKNSSNRSRQNASLLLLLALTPLSIRALGAPGAAIAMTLFYVIHGRGRLLD